MPYVARFLSVFCSMNTVSALSWPGFQRSSENERMAPAGFNRRHRKNHRTGGRAWIPRQVELRVQKRAEIVLACNLRGQAKTAWREEDEVSRKSFYGWQSRLLKHAAGWVPTTSSIVPLQRVGADVQNVGALHPGEEDCTPQIQSKPRRQGTAWMPLPICCSCSKKRPSLAGSRL